MYQRTMQGRLRLPPGVGASIPDLRGREVLAVAPLIALMLFLGFYPKPLADVITPAVDATMQDAGVSDPEPTQGRGANTAAPTR
jgi:NADH-quinone oxidoreductase subunit M